MEYGKIELRLAEIMEQKQISKNRICKDLDIPRSNFNRYYRNEFQRLDALLLCKLCWYLEVDINELVHYTRPAAD